MRRMLVLLWICMLLPAVGMASELGFAEEFALSDNREKTLERLVPGTEAYYYYHALHYQLDGRTEELNALMKIWIDRYKYTPQVREILNRQALLDYPKDNRKSLAYLIDRLNLRFTHRRILEGARPSHPTSLDPTLYNPERMVREAVARYNNLQGVSDAGLRHVDPTQLNEVRLRHWLERLDYPDVENLPALVVKDLNNPRTGGFGSLSIHRNLTLPQLQQLRGMMPNLLSNEAFVTAYLLRLRPGPDEDAELDPAVRAAHLERMWTFVRDLPPTWNSLRAHLMYQMLVHKRAQGTYDQALFLDYLKLPRPVWYVPQPYLKDVRGSERVNLSANFHDTTMLPPIGSDDALVRDFLLHIFVDAPTFKPYLPYVTEEHLQRLFAEAKITAGVGDMERWYSLLRPEEVQALRERVDVDLLPDNRAVFAPGEAVTLGAAVKHVDKLLVRVYPIHTVNWYRNERRPVPLDIDLEGMISRDETVYEYDEVPTRRVARTFTFPRIQERGVYVIDFIGNGVSSRAVVNIGGFRLLERTSASGHVFTVVNEANEPVPEATLWVDGQHYTPDERGMLRVPFTTSPGKREAIVEHAGFAAPVSFAHKAEAYTLHAGFYVDRESLLPGARAPLVIRPLLTVADTPVSLQLIRNPVLTIHAMDRYGIPTTRQITDLTFENGKDTVTDFLVPENLAQLSMTLQVDVRSLSTGESTTLTAQDSFPVIRQENRAAVGQFLLSRTADGFLLFLTGDMGEPLVNRPVNVSWGSPLISSHTYSRTLQTDGNGIIQLGDLGGLELIRAQTQDGIHQEWLLPANRVQAERVVHARAGAPIAIPYAGEESKPTRQRMGLLRVCPNGFHEDVFQALRIQEGYILIPDLDKGDYVLALHEQRIGVTIRVTDGGMREGWILGTHRLLETKNPAPLQVAPPTMAREEIAFRIHGADPMTRVHVVATRFVPEYSLFNAMTAAAPWHAPLALTEYPMESIYQSGRAVGDEVRYILDRRHQRIFPGNMLRRASLLLNPWSPEESTIGREQAAADGAFGRRAGRGRSEAHGGGAQIVTRQSHAGSQPTLDFLTSQSLTLYNLQPDDEGMVRIPRESLAGFMHLHILAHKPGNTVYRQTALTPADVERRDLRFAAGLDPEKHFIESRRVSILRKGESIRLPAGVSTDAQPYTTIGDVFDLYLTLSGNTELAKFSFLNRWDTLPDDDKLAKYAEFASHELHLFLYHKDRAFFDAVIRPYLANKKDKQFVDDWLLGADLDAYLEPWAFGQLNVVEKVLLARRVQARHASVARWVRERAELLPPNPQRDRMLFDTAIRSTALDANKDVDFGYASYRGDVKDALRSREGRALKIGGRMSSLDDKRKDMDHAPRRQMTPPPPSVTAENGVVPSAPAPMPGEAAGLALADEVDVALDVEIEERESEDAGELLRWAMEESRSGRMLDMIERLGDDVAAREGMRALYRPVPPTKVWVESNYHKLPVQRQTPELIPVNPFWAAYAAQEEGSFLSEHLAECGSNLPEMMLALAVLDLPFEAVAPDGEMLDDAFALHAKSDTILFHKEIRPAEVDEGIAPVLVGQNLFQLNDRYRHENNERVEKYVTGDLLTQTIYGVRVVVTNPTERARRFDVLLQIPNGSLPLHQTQRTNTVNIAVGPYETQALEYLFYFPATGDFTHFPAHVSEAGALAVAAPGQTLRVVESIDTTDKTSWAWISQNGTLDDVLAYLDANNIARTDLHQIAWRMQEADAADAIFDFLDARHIFHPVLWIYAFKHNDPTQMRTYLMHREDFVRQCGAYLESTLLTVDPVKRAWYEHMEFDPLLHARAHRFGRRRQILNPRLFAQYDSLMRVLRYQQQPDDAMNLALAYYLFLQDRTEEALDRLGRVNPDGIPERMQYDAMHVYAAFYTNDIADAKALATTYSEHPVRRWRNWFGAALQQIAEIEGAAVAVIDEESREERQTQLAATDPHFDFTIEAGEIALEARNLDTVVVNYYRMDLEILFSRQPFRSGDARQFAYIEPTESILVALDDKTGTSKTIAIPETLRHSNVMVEIVGAGERKSAPYFANAMHVLLARNYGQVTVTAREGNAPLPKTYVKVYARMRGGEERFWKDGYTDLRGRFDYASVSGGSTDRVERFSLLILHEEHGAVVREVEPPRM